MDTLKMKLQDVIDSRMDEFYDYLRLDSVSTQDRKIPETVEYVKGMLEKTGGEVQVLDDLGGNPVVYGFFPAGKGGNKDKTLLFYNHYDVQPEDPIDEWESAPFEPTVKDDILYCRGVADNKANLMVRLNAIQALLDSEEGLSCNVKFLIEGEEENGSPSLGGYLEKYADLFKSDACIWEFGGKDEDENYVIEAGIKGMAYFDLYVESADVDIHSSIGAVVDNAAWRLTHALASLRNADNQVLVEGFYDDITPPTDFEKEVVARKPFDEEKTKELYGLKHPLITKDLEWTPNEALAFYPTMTICGFISGYTGPGSKTVLPRAASAKLDCRIVPGQDPEKIHKLIRTHLDKNGFEDIKLDLIKAQKAFRSDLKNNFVDIVVESAKKAYGEGTDVVLSPNNAGTGPMYNFDKYLNLPVLSSGCGWANSKAHAPNESVRLKDFFEGTAHMAYLLQDFGK
ncbi:Acetylornithine deacetylase/Succinyl-diaminopimelate desuccinylase [Marinilactibacillus piezotolerans]|uniref:Acetylornithine deacetylase/Succinyl-diaminopimelate desuccinylase n=1 Tax=Marinilactibacillus piezotolerans TaxID=258723 RepID=A0A1I3Y5H3_9LACT|nr:M20/M25/M40 family metallo-hydrolase [Marinilactibacillus piezotolerans]SFK27065.1 Acetylornithine deacetylase/Succinyl-diaminopimelate desuccinylase [Marinilactibacillus piezotolerans]